MRVQDSMHLACSGLLAVSCKKMVFSFPYVNPLIDQAFLVNKKDLLYCLDSISVHKHAKKKKQPGQ